MSKLNRIKFEYQRFAAIGAIAASCMLSPSANAASHLGSNLIVNGDAEADVGSSNGSKIAAISGFVTTGDFTVVTYGAFGGFPIATDPGPFARGLNFFAGGPNASSSSGSQLIDLSSIASLVDLGTVTFDLSGYLGGFTSQRDNGVLTVQFLDESQTSLASASIGPVSNIDRSSSTGLLFREASGLVPVATRFAQVNLQFSRLDGSYNDGYADNLSLVLGAVPEPESWALAGAGLLALGAHSLLRKRRA